MIIKGQFFNVIKVFLGLVEFFIITCEVKITQPWDVFLLSKTVSTVLFCSVQKLLVFWMLKLVPDWQVFV